MQSLTDGSACSHRRHDHLPSCTLRHRGTAGSQDSDDWLYRTSAIGWRSRARSNSQYSTKSPGSHTAMKALTRNWDPLRHLKHKLARPYSKLKDCFRFLTIYRRYDSKIYRDLI